MIKELLSHKEFLLLFILCCLQFFGCAYFPSILSRFMTPLILFMSIASMTEQRRGLFNREIYLLFFLFIINAFSAYFLNGQWITKYFGFEFGIFVMLLTYFIFNNLNYSLKTLEKIVYILCFAFCSAYIIQILVYPIVIFNGAAADTAMSSGGFSRVRLTGQGLATLSYFLAINRLLQKRQVIKNLILLSMGFLVVVMLGFRTQLVFLIFCTLLLVIKYYGFNRKFFVAVFILLAITPLVMQIPVINDSVSKMEERSKDDSFSNKNYVRYYSLNYYLGEMKKHPVAWVTGLGLPGKDCAYSDKMEAIKSKGLIWADWGILGLTFMLGVPTVLLLLWIFIKAFMIRVPKNYYYIGVWFIFLIFASLLTRELFREGNCLIEAFMLAMLNKLHIKYSNN